MITINCKQVLLNFKGDPMTSSETNKPIEIGTIISNVLAGKTANPSLAWVLGKKFATQKKVDLLAEEAVFVKEEVQKIGTDPNGWLSGLLCGQILEVIESKPKKAVDEDKDDEEDEVTPAPKPKKRK